MVVLITVLATAVCILIALNLTVGEKKVRHEISPQVFARPSLCKRRFMDMLAVVYDGLARFGFVFSTYHDVSPYTVIGELGTYSAANKHFYMWDSARMNGNLQPHNQAMQFLKI